MRLLEELQINKVQRIWALSRGAQETKVDQGKPVE